MADKFHGNIQPSLDLDEHQHLGPDGEDGPGARRTYEADLAVRLDDTTTTNVTYIGVSAPGTATSAAEWSIKKLDETSGLIITWADGDNRMNNIWDNRASLSYS